MPDRRGAGDITPEPNVKVQKLWTEQQIAETETRIKELEAKAERILRGELKGLEAEVIQLKRKNVELYKKLDNLDKFGGEEVVVIEGINVMKQLPNQGG